MVIKLRCYQEEAIKAIKDSYSTGVNKQLIVLPTGSGKTIIFSKLIVDLNKRTLVISHRTEIIKQTIATLQKLCKKAVGYLYSKERNLDSDIIVASIQSCYRGKIKPEILAKDFDVLIIDEAHHSSSKTYKALINELGFNNSHNKLLLGFTATPDLSNGNTLGDIYDDIIYSKQIVDLIKSKHLSSIVGRKIRTNVNLKGVDIKRGDYSVPILSRIVNSKSRNNLIIDKYKEHIKGSRAVAFCCTIKHAQNLSTAFNESGIKSDCIYGSMDTRERTHVLTALKNSNIEVLTSVGVLTEGFDMPEINAIIMARPTKSKSLYIQMIGRGLRRHEDKVKCTVLDFIDIDNNLKQSMNLGWAVPSAKTEVDVRKGDSCIVPPMALDFKFDDIIDMLTDEEFNILGESYIEKKEVNPVLCNMASKAAKASALLLLNDGKLPGRAPFGYENIRLRDGSSFIEVKEDEAEMVRLAFKLYGNDANCSIPYLIELIKEESGLKVSKSNLANILKNSFYYGVIGSVYGDFTHKYETIIDKETFDKAQRKILINNSSKKNKKDLIYKRLITCADCGCAVCGYVKKEVNTYYKCTQSKGKHGAKTLNGKYITNSIVDTLSKLKISDKLLDYLVLSLNIGTEVKNEKFKLNLRQLLSNLPVTFNSISTNDKRKVLNMVFSSIKIKDEAVLFELKTPFYV